ncbi:LytR family transcriptional regulator [Ectobacillus funiculus]|uniref:polyisoprenyl-teichoic acid--peptidoglycan teichoic acid transferase TagU n=1 Tax=Ectobacillus funiculus TaxID=137993 RepID=UPI00397AC661
MKKKILLWILGIIGVLVIGGGIYAYTLYSKVSNTLEAVQQPLNREKSEKREDNVDLKSKTPISILMLGADERADEVGRSDTLLVITLNPNTKSMKMVSIPRDTYTEIVGKGVKDKINHAYAFGGIDMSVNTVENFLDIPIDYYIEVNMAGFKDIVNAVGGVDVVNDLDFTYSGHHFAKGPIHLNGEEALAYSRMRKEDPRGDFGRQMRQRQVIKAVIQKGAKFDSLANFGDILGAIQRNVKTNLSQDDMFRIQQDYAAARNETEEIQIEGTGGIAADGIWYYHVSEETRQQLSQKLRQHLELK